MTRLLGVMTRLLGVMTRLLGVMTRLLGVMTTDAQELPAEFAPSFYGNHTHRNAGIRYDSHANNTRTRIADRMISDDLDGDARHAPRPAGAPALPTAWYPTTPTLLGNGTAHAPRSVMMTPWHTSQYWIRQLERRLPNPSNGLKQQTKSSFAAIPGTAVSNKAPLLDIDPEKWIKVFRGITNATNERTFLAASVPQSG